jgi:acyl carrier protein
MQNMFETVSEIIASTSDVSVGDIRADSHIMEDLGIDSLAFLDIAFEIEQKFNIKLPIEDWMQTAKESTESSQEILLVGNLCKNIEKIVARAPAAA